jgi:hypothetical protein
MKSDRTARERLAGLIILSGIISTVPAVARETTTNGQNIWKVVAHSSGASDGGNGGTDSVCGGGKGSVCGKCASQGLCGTAYREMHRKDAKLHSTSRKRVRTRGATTTGSKKTK